ncbi:MAG: ABC transporter permease [Anaerolineae bacterium]
MTALTQHFGFEFRTGIRNKSLLLLNYLFPIGFYLMASAMMTGLNPGFRETLIPAMIYFTILASTMLGLPDPIVTAREAGVYRSYKIHGIPKLSILLIPVLTTILHTLIVSLLIIVSAPLLFQAVLPSDWPSFVLSYVLMAFACASLGLLIGVVAPSSRMTVMLSQAVFLPSMMIGGLMFPAHMLPEGLRKLALLLPSNHAMNVMNSTISDTSLLSFYPLGSALVLLTGGLLALGLALYLFNWDSQNKVRSNMMIGLLALLPYVAAAVLALFTTPV